MRVLITGARNWEDRLHLYRVLNGICEEFDLNYPSDEHGNTMPDPSKTTIVTGACPTGADHWAEQWCIGNDFLAETHPADWDRHGKSAGFNRNKEMVRLGADLCLAFWGPCGQQKCADNGLVNHGSHGTAHCASQAAGAGISVLWIYPE